MRIDNQSLINIRAGQSQGAQGVSSGVRGSGEGNSGLEEASSYTSAPELVHLLELVQQTPDVRQELLRQIAERIANGEYLTSQSAAETAEALLKAAE
jgi:Anti-sigma-28 factor, FlgM